MEKLTERIDKGIRERVAFLFDRDKIHERRKMKEVATHAGQSQGAVSKWRVGLSTPEAANIVSLAEYFKVSPLWILTGEEQGKKYANEQGRIVGEIRDRSLLEIERWVKSTNDGLDYGPMIKGLVAKEYTDFREWLKKNAHEEQCGTRGYLGEINGTNPHR